MKSLTKPDLCAGALREGEGQLLDLHFSGRFLLTASKRRQMISLCISLIIAAIPANRASKFQ
jgi:hypothetical protein